MTIEPPPLPRQAGRSAIALFIGFLAVVIPSLGTDQIMHSLNIYPPWGEPMNETSDNLLALAYRCAYGALGSYLAARFAPRHPMRYAMILGVIGFALSLLGAIAAIPLKLGPSWYPISLVVTALPCAWLGGRFHHWLRQRRQTA
ncbi:MAG: hypothetical protein ACKV2V_25685 [Blastocatellia bacterium]